MPAPDYARQLADIVKAIQQIPHSPDYTYQLQEVTKALNKPTTSPWTIAFISASVAVLGSLLGQSVFMLIADWHKSYELRGVLYRELVNMFGTIDAIMSQKHIDDPMEMDSWRRREVETHLTFRSVDHMKQNQELYINLPEHFVADTLYGRFKIIVTDWNSFNVNTDFALRFFARAVHEGSLRKFWLRWLLGRRGYRSLLTRTEHYWNLEQGLTASMIASGVMPRPE
jgi:hypothetical protein